MSDHNTIFTYMENSTYLDKIYKMINSERKRQMTMQNYIKVLIREKYVKYL